MLAWAREGSTRTTLRSATRRTSEGVGAAPSSDGGMFRRKSPTRRVPRGSIARVTVGRRSVRRPAPRAAGRAVGEAWPLSPLPGHGPPRPWSDNGPRASWPPSAGRSRPARRARRAGLPERRDRGVTVLQQQGHERAGRVEGRPASRKKSVQPRLVDVDPVVDGRRVQGLLGRHVVGGAEDTAGLRQ